MNKTLSLKLTGLGGVVAALVLTSGCMGGGGDKPDLNQAVQTACTSIARTCADGSTGVLVQEPICHSACPEDKDYETAIKSALSGTGTGTSTGTSTSTATATASTVTCPSDTFSCPNGSTVGRDSANSCSFKACPVVN